MVQCKKCKKSVTKDSEQLKCGDCGGKYHKMCLKPDTAIPVGKAWICNNCERASGNSSATNEEDGAESQSTNSAEMKKKF